MLDLWSVATLVFASFAGGVVSGFAGFAFSAVAGAVLLHVYPATAAIPLMMACSILCQISSMIYLRRNLDWTKSLSLLTGGVFGIPVAIALFQLIEPGLFRQCFGWFLAGYSAYTLLKPRVVMIQRSGLISNTAVGFGGGVIGGLTAMPGALPTIWCDLRGVSKEAQRGMVQPFIAAMQCLALGMLLTGSGTFPDTLVEHLLISLPGLALGTFLGLRLFGKVDEVYFRKATLGLLFVSGLALTA